MTNQIPSTKRDESAVTFTAPAPLDGEEAAPRPGWALTENRLPLFDYTDEDGEAVTVTMPAIANPGLALRFLRQARTIGLELAISWLIEEAIGAEAYEALANELEHLEDPTEGPIFVQRIGRKVQEVVMGGLEAPKA